MKTHLSYANKLRNQAETRDPKGGRSFEAHKFSGRYVMKCEAIQHQWPLLAKQLHIRVISDGRLAFFDLGIVVGLMLLGKSPDRVTKLVQDGNWDADLLDEEDLAEIESEDTSSDEDNSDDERASGRSEDSRLYFQWRGYNTRSGVIQFDPQNHNTGYLEFANSDGSVFKGHMDAMGREMSFQGYGVPGLCGPLTMDWNALSHLASEKAKVPEYVI